MKKGLDMTTTAAKISKEDLERIQCILHNKYEINTSIHSAGVFNQYTLYIKTDSMERLINLVKPYVVRSMYYKLGI